MSNATDITTDRMKGVQQLLIVAASIIEGCLHVIDELGGDPDSLNVNMMNRTTGTNTVVNARQAANLIKAAAGMKLHDVTVQLTDPEDEESGK